MPLVNAVLPKLSQFDDVDTWAVAFAREVEYALSATGQYVSTIAIPKARLPSAAQPGIIATVLDDAVLGVCQVYSDGTQWLRVMDGWPVDTAINDKITANGVTLTTFTSGDVVADLQANNDGNLYVCTEVGGGTNQLVVDFAAVTAFNWVRVLAHYNGNAAHNMVVQLEITPFDGSLWHTFDTISHQAAGTPTMEDHSFFIPDEAAYIDSGVTKVRFVHSAGVTPNHLFTVDECSLYQLHQDGG